VGGQGNDLLYGDHSDKSLTVFNGGNDVVYGNLGNDTCYGGAGADWVRGGQGDDVLYGEDGNDWMSGDRGSDTLTGGAGADVFYGFKGMGLDYVTDFSRAQGDRIQLAVGTSYTLRQDGANAVVDLGNSDQIVLADVQASALTGDWLFFA
jgi:serralysin